MRRILSFVLLFVCCLINAQNYQSDPSKLWGNWCYKELNGKWSSASNGQTALEMPTSPDMTVAYYWRIPNGHVRADMIWTTAQGQHATLKVKVSYPTTGEVLGEYTVSNADVSSTEKTNELFGDINFPKDDFYRVELSCENWSLIKSIKYFNLYHESSLPALAPRNIGGTSAHMFDWATTDPNAPKPNTNSYDWAYVECMVPYEYQYPGTYYMTIGALNSYMGMQSAGQVGEDDFNRSVLFSVWDNGNTDVDPNLPDYMKSGVMEGHPESYQTHGGGEGSSSSCMLADQTKWWRPNEWVQFLLNTRPETTTVTVKKDGKDSTFLYENTIMTVFYKMHDDPEWTFLGTLRASGVNDMIAGWYSFIEPFSTSAGQFKHRAYYRNGFLRAANSGKWYSRNRVVLINDKYDRDFHYDFGRGASNAFENCFFLDMGGYVAQNDSADVIPLARNKEAVDTINISRLEQRIDSAIRRDAHYEFNGKMFKTAKDFRLSSISILSADKNAKSAFDGNEEKGWVASKCPQVLDLKLYAPTEFTSMSWYWAYQYDYRCRYMDVYTSKDGKKWDMLFDSLEIRIVDRPTIRFPYSFKTQYVRFRFYDPIRAGNLMFNEIYLKSTYQDDAVKALAKEYIDNAGKLNYFSPEATAKVKAVYNDGNPSSTQDLVNALFAMSESSDTYKYARVNKLVHLSSQRAYRIENMYGYGVLSANEKGVTVKGATVEGAKEEFSAAAPVDDDYNNWMILHDEAYSCYFLYNVGAGKFFNTSGEGNLSDKPQKLSMSVSGKGYIFNISPRSIAVNPAGEGFEEMASTAKQTQFYIYDNYQKEQTSQKRDSLLSVVEPLGMYSLYRTAANKLLNVPIGVVGGFVTEEARDAFRQAYNAAKESNPQPFIDAVDNADIIAFDAENTVYKIKNTTATTPYLSSAVTNSAVARQASADAASIWRFSAKGLGYTMSSQGCNLKPQPLTESTTIGLSADKAEAGTYFFSEKEPATYYLSHADYSSYVISAMRTPVVTATNTSSATTWYIEPCTSISLKTNDVGVTTAYYDFAIEIPEGVKAYRVVSVTSEGVVKLSELNGIIPAGTGFVLKGSPSTSYDVRVLNADAATPDVNLLRGTYFRNTSMEKDSFYTLTTENNDVVMKKPALATMAANQCYLSAEDVPDVEILKFDFDNIVDGVQTAVSGQANGAIHTLGGVQVLKTEKGRIYIKNHRAVLIP